MKLRDMKRVGIIGGGNADLAEKVAKAVDMANENIRKCVVISNVLDEHKEAIERQSEQSILGNGARLVLPYTNTYEGIPQCDLSNVNPRSFYRKPKLSLKQEKARKASKQAKKSRKTNRRK